MALDWISPAEGREKTYKKLYLAYQPGYPLMVADWKTGYGYRDVRTGESVNPIRVAYINLPDEEESARKAIRDWEGIDWV